jgi:hypothetical protein
MRAGTVWRSLTHGEERWNSTCAASTFGLVCGRAARDTGAGLSNEQWQPERRAFNALTGAALHVEHK